jgi:hypothetical protein
VAATEATTTMVTTHRKKDTIIKQEAKPLV